MIKKISFIVGVVILAGAWMFLSLEPTDETARPSDIAQVGTEETQKGGQQPKEDSPAATSNQTPYYGQSLEYLGDSKILAKYPTEFVNERQKRLQYAVDFVKNEPGASSHWMEIGLIKKTFNNYVGARDVWEYVASVFPNDPTNYYNLGNLYGSYLKDFQKAEQNYFKAISLQPYLAYTHLGLATFYQDFYKEKFDKVDDVLLAGLKYIPDDPEITLALALYYKAAGDKSGAIDYFQKFLKFPELTGAQQSSIEREIEELRNQAGE